MPILDFAIVGITLVTGLYCLVLNHRLKRLHDLKGGLGGAVTALAQSVSQLKTESEAVSTRMNAASDRIERLLVQVDACEPRIDTLLETMDRQSRQIWREDKARMSRTRNEMLEIGKDAKILAGLLNDQLCAVASRAETADSANTKSARSPAGTAGGTVVRVGGRDERAANPYARKVAG